MLRYVIYCGVAIAVGCCGLIPEAIGQVPSGSPVATVEDVAPGQELVEEPAVVCAEHEPVCVEHGKQRPIIDGIGWVIGIPRKVLLWDCRAENHHVSDETVAEVAEYLDHKGLDQTVVRVNQYAPLKEWNRLVGNRKVGAGWRYTIGTLHLVRYTVLPGRIFGGDEYNPYTDSLYLYSDMPTLGLAEAAYAKDVKYRIHPGTYAALQDLPGVSMWHETLATREVITYISIHGSSEEIEKVRHDLYSRYGIKTAGAVGQFVPDGSGLFTIVGAVSGHAVAAEKNRRERAE